MCVRHQRWPFEVHLIATTRVQLLLLFHLSAHEDKRPKPLNQKTITHQGLYQSINLLYYYISSLTQTPNLHPVQFVRNHEWGEEEKWDG